MQTTPSKFFDILAPLVGEIWYLIQFLLAYQDYQLPWALLCYSQIACLDGMPLLLSSNPLL